MSRLLATFKASIAETARQLKIDWHAFRRQKGIDDFLIDASERQDSPQELAARFLAECCQGKTKMDQAVCLGAVNFLDTVLSKRPASHADRIQRLKDCIDVANNPGTYEECLKWAQGWF